MRLKYGVEFLSDVRTERIYGLTQNQAIFCVNNSTKLYERKEIRACFKAGLTEKQIKVLVNKGFDEKQMREGRQGFENGLSIEQVMLFADVRYDDRQMAEIRYGFERGLSIEQVYHYYADYKFNFKQMHEIRLSLLVGLSNDQVTLLADENFNSRQMYEIRMGFAEGLSMEQVLVYADAKYASEDMRAVRMSYAKGVTLKQAMFALDQENTGYSVYNVCQWLSFGLTEEQITRCKKLGLDAQQIYFIINGSYGDLNSEFINAGIEKTGEHIAYMRDVENLNNAINSAISGFSKEELEELLIVVKTVEKTHQKTKVK
ncbi:MAG: hypothetical protein HFH46_01385 [Bacilli bacterium]|nr:hypothetical protein [Bacilli bacterium]